MRIFCLPDLGEGLTEAEIREWHVAAGDRVVRDQPLVAVETAKAIVDIPAPETGVVLRLFGPPGTVLHTGDPLVEFRSAEAEGATDSGTVVGELERGDEVLPEEPSGDRAHAAAVKATPAVRALAHRLNVDLSMVTPSGPDGLITTTDVQRVARILAEVGPMEPLRGVRRAMARNMTRAHAEVVPVTLHDDADIHAWEPGADISVRLLQALAGAAAREPALNAWYDGHAVGRRLLQRVDAGIAIDTADGLFVPVLRDVGNREAAELRAELDRLKGAIKTRTISPEALRGPTILLSNFGTLAGRYGTPVVIPPAVAILGCGTAREVVVADRGEPAVRRILPLSLTFDHRAVTGAEAARFLGAVIDALAGSA